MLTVQYKLQKNQLIISLLKQYKIVSFAWTFVFFSVEKITTKLRLGQNEKYL